MHPIRPSRRERMGIYARSASRGSSSASTGCGAAFFFFGSGSGFFSGRAVRTERTGFFFAGFALFAAGDFGVSGAFGAAVSGASGAAVSGAFGAAGTPAAFTGSSAGGGVGAMCRPMWFSSSGRIFSSSDINALLGVVTARGARA